MGNKDLSPGTAIATFENGRYPNRPHGNHAAFYLGQVANGIYVVDQWRNMENKPTSNPATTQTRSQLSSRTDEPHSLHPQVIDDSWPGSTWDTSPCIRRQGPGLPSADLGIVSDDQSHRRRLASLHSFANFSAFGRANRRAARTPRPAYRQGTNRRKGHLDDHV